MANYSLVIDYSFNRNVTFKVTLNGKILPEGTEVQIIDETNALINLPTSAIVNSESKFQVNDLGVKEIFGGPWPISVKYNDKISNLVYINPTYGTGELGFTLHPNYHYIYPNIEYLMIFTIRYNGVPIKANVPVLLEAPLGNWVNIPTVRYITNENGSFTVPNLRVLTMRNIDAPLRVKIGLPESTIYTYTNNYIFAILDPDNRYFGYDESDGYPFNEGWFNPNTTQ
jgi:hypothetical protein